jgi:transcriptional regulator with XRE-family HTH domain
VRLARGLSQTELGELIGVTLQQVQKYENAKRGSSPKLVRAH